MQKKVFIIHGWDGYPEEGWFPWIKTELEKRGFQVDVPAMPNPFQPTIEEWVSYLAQIAGEADKNTFFIGHSIGCQTILRYLEKLPQNAKIGGVIFVAGWFTLMNLKTDEEKEIAKPWLEKPINGKKVLEHTKNILVILSDNDDVVPLDNIKLFQKKLGAKIIIEHGKGHFSGGDGIKEMPNVLNGLLSFAQQKHL